MHDEYRAGGVLDDVSADRSEQESDEPAEATTADDEHRRTLRRIKEHPRGVWSVSRILDGSLRVFVVQAAAAAVGVSESSSARAGVR